MHVHLCVLRCGCFLLASLVLYFVPPFSFQPFLMFTSAFNERSRSNPLCDFRLGTVVTTDHETPLTEFVQAHDDGVWQCVCNLLPLVLGGLGLRSAGRSRVPAHWASWADCIPMIFDRHPVVAERLLRQLEWHPTTLCLRVAASAAQSLEGVLGWSPPSCKALANGERPESRPLEEFEPGARRGGWQHEAALRTEQRFRDVELFARLDDTGQALLRSQGGPGAGLALTACPLCRVTSISSFECCSCAACTSPFP